MNEEAGIHNLYTLSVKFKDSDEKINVYLSASEKQRFERNLYDEQLNSPARFFAGRTLDDKMVAINLSKIQTLRILRDPIMTHAEQLIKILPAQPELEYLLEGRPGLDAVGVAGDKPGNLSAFFSDLQDADVMEPRFLGFFDSDWEQILFNIYDLLYLEAPHSVMKLEEEMEEEEENEDA